MNKIIDVSYKYFEVVNEFKKGCSILVNKSWLLSIGDSLELRELDNSNNLTGRKLIGNIKWWQNDDLYINVGKSCFAWVDNFELIIV